MCSRAGACRYGWAEELPEGCPPEDAFDASGQVLYRFVKTNPATMFDFASHAALGLTKSPTQCGSRSVSLFASLSRCQAMRDLPRFRGNGIAELELPVGSGVLKEGKNSHHDWWPCGASNPVLFIRTIQ